MAEIEKEEVCHHVARGVSIKSQHLTFHFIIYIVQLYKEDCPTLGICWAVAIPITLTVQGLYVHHNSAAAKD